MYLHLGEETVVRDEDIIGIFDLDTSTVSKKTRDYLSDAQKKGMIVNVSSDLPRSFVLCRTKKGSMIYICRLSPATLVRRSESITRASEQGKD